MSTSVDNRIVQLTFDNKQFEQEVKQSMNSLKQLEETIKNGGSSKAVETLGEGFNKIGSARFEEVANSVDKIKDRFSVMGIVGMRVIQNLTDKAMAFVGKGLGAIKDSLFTGGWQRAANLEQAKFLLEGLGADVKAILRDVDDALTGTAYGLDEGAKTAAIFFTSGVKQGKEMFTALRAVAGAAAMTGKNYQEIADVFQDAAAKGSIMTMEINRLQQQGVKADKYLLDFINDVVDGGKKVENVSDDVKAKVMDLTDGAKLNLKDLTEDRKGLLSKGAIQFEIFAAAMDYAFGEHAQEANKTFDGALANMQTSLKRMTEPFYTDIREGGKRIFNALRLLFKTFGNMILKDNPVLKNFHELRRYLTNNIIAFLSDLNLNLEGPKKGKTNWTFLFATFKSLSNIAVGFINILKQLRQGFYDVFDIEFGTKIKEYANDFAGLTKKFKNWTSETTAFQIISRGFFKAVQTLGIIIKFLYNQFKGLISIFKEVINFAKPLIDVVSSVTEGFRKMVESVTSYINKINIFGKIANALKRGFDFILGAVGGFGTAFIDFIKKLGESMTSSFENFLKFIVGLHILKRLKETKVFFTTASQTLQAITDLSVDTAKMLQSLAKIPAKIGKILDEIRKSFVAWQKSLKAAQLIAIASAIYIVALAVEKLQDLKADNIATILGTIAGSLAMLTGVLVVLDKVFSLKVSKVNNIYDVLNNFVKNLPGGSNHALEQAGRTMLAIAGSMLILAHAIKILGKLDREEVIQGGIAVTAMLAIMLAITRFLSKDTKELFENRKMTKGMTGLIAMALSVKILANVLKELSEIPWDRLQESVTALGLVLGEVAGFSVLMSRGGKDGGDVKVKSFILMAISMKILGSALADLAAIDWDSMANAMTAMFFVLAMLAGFAHATKNVGTGGAGLIMAAASMVLIAHALQQLAQVPYDSLQELGGVLILIFATLGAAMAVASKFLVGAAALVVVAAALNLLILPLATLSAIPIDNLMQGLLGMAAALAIVGAAMAFFGAAIAPIVVGAVALGAASVSIMIFAAALAGLGAAFSMLSLGVQAAWKTIKLILTDIGKALKWIWEKVSGFIDKITGAGDKLNSKKMTKNSSKLGKDMALSMGKGFATAIPEAIKTFSSSSDKIINGLNKGISEKGKKIPKTMKSKIEDAEKEVTNKKGDFETAGESLSSGVASGIRNGESSVISATGYIANIALRSFKEKLGISSPSKEFMKASSWIPAGIVKGLKMNAFRVNREVDSLSFGMLNAMQEAVAKSYDMLNNNGDLNPVITPTLDLTQIQNGMGNMQSLFSNRQISASIRAREINGTFNGTTTDALLNKVIRTIGEQAKAAENHFSNTFNVNGGVNPEDFATRVARRLEMEMRV